MPLDLFCLPLPVCSVKRYGMVGKALLLKSYRPEPDSRLPKPLRFELFRASVFFSEMGGIISTSAEEMKAC